MTPAATSVSWPVACSLNQQMVMRLQMRGYVANVPFLLRASGALDLDTLKDALQIVVDRHEILRSSFALVGKVLVQHAPQACTVEIRFRDLAGEANPLAAAQAECARACRTAFAIDAVRRLDVWVYPLAKGDNLIAVTVDHLVADGMSLGILAAEWRSSYQAIDAGVPLQLSPSPPQYRSFSARQHEWLQSCEAEAARRWWTERLRGYRAARRDREHGVRRAASLDFSLASEVGARISALCTRYKLTPFMVVLAAYVIVLAGLECETDIVIATVRANRRDDATRGLVGNVANLIPIRVGFQKTDTAKEFLSAVRTLVRETYVRDTLPFLEIADLASRRLDISPAALARYAINFVPFPGAPDIWSPELRVSQQWGLLEARPLSTGIASLFIRQQGMRFGGTLIADPVTVPTRWMHAFATYLAASILRLAEAPQCSLSELICAVYGG